MLQAARTVFRFYIPPEDGVVGLNCSTFHLLPTSAERYAPG